MITDIIGFTAMILATLSLFPQIHQAYTTKKVDDLSGSMVLILLVASVLWTIYGALIEDLPMFLTNLILTISSLYLLYIKRKYHVR